MFDHTSRYYHLADALYTTSEGRRVLYKTRRLLPQGKDLPLLTEVTVSGESRLDLIAYRTLGDPLQFWRIADANDAMDPFQLVRRPGRLLRIPNIPF